MGFFYLLFSLDTSCVRSMCTVIAQATTRLSSKTHLKLAVTEFLKQPLLTFMLWTKDSPALYCADKWGCVSKSQAQVQVSKLTVADVKPKCILNWSLNTPLPLYMLKTGPDSGLSSWCILWKNTSDKAGFVINIWEVSHGNEASEGTYRANYAFAIWECVLVRD